MKSKNRKLRKSSRKIPNKITKPKKRNRKKENVRKKLVKN